MKNLLTSVLLGLISLTATASSRGSNSEMETAAELAGVAEGLLTIGERVIQMQELGYGLYRDGYSIYGKHMTAGSQADVECHFRAGQSIRVLGGGNDAALDVDLRVFSPSGSEVVKDTREHADAGVRFTTPVTGDYRLRLEMFKAERKSAAFGVLVVMQIDGHRMETDDLAKVVAKQMYGNAIYAAVANSMGRDLRFQRSDSSWSLLGAVLGNNGSAKCWMSNVEKGPTMITVFADPNAIDIDLEVSDGTGRWSETDDAPDAEPTVEFIASSQQDYAVAVSAPKTDAATLTVTSILHIQ